MSPASEPKPGRCAAFAEGGSGMPDLQALRQLASRPRLPCVTLQLPLEPHPRAAHSALGARQATEAAGKRLAELALPTGLSRRMAGFLDAVRNAAESQTGAAGTLVALVDAERVRLAPLACRLPARVVVARAFALRPLLRALARGSRYRLLAVSEQRVALFEGDVHGLSPAACRDLAEALAGCRKDAGGGEREGGAAAFHRALGWAVARRFAGDGTPLALAASRTDQAGLRAALRVHGLLDEGVVAGPDALTPRELHRRAFPLVAAALARREQRVLARFEEALRLHRSIDRVEDVARAVAEGPPGILWVEEDASLPGSLDPSSGTILDPVADDDVMDHLVMRTLARGGEVHVVAPGDLPAPYGVAAAPA